MPSRTRPACQLSCPAACEISWAISCGWEISDKWLAFTSMVLAFIRFAMKRSRSGLIVRSSVDTAYQLGFERQAGAGLARREDIQQCFSADHDHHGARV